MKKEIATEFTVDATPQQVWEVLLDFDAYPDWNPFIVSIAGRSDVGQRLEAALKQPGKKAQTFKPTVLRSDEARGFTWLGTLGFRGLFDGEHRWEIADDGDGTTKVVQAERFSGILVRPIMAMIGESTRAGFEAMNAAMAERLHERAA